jgi:hypothetical protein
MGSFEYWGVREGEETEGRLRVRCFKAKDFFLLSREN